MAAVTSIRCFDYVNHPYQDVCRVLTAHGNEVFHKATNAAETRAGTVAAGLHANVAGMEFEKEILVSVNGFAEVEDPRNRKLTVHLQWKAAQNPQLFPVMEAQLHIYPITGSETQLDFQGEYEPPLGILGKAIDAVIGHRVAEASVHHFVSDVADFLRTTIK